ncbi:MAG: septum formation initiator family protein [Candidatus Cloacimonas sp.]|jgi:cell division protein FtsB|nr:septum formation initiator family protein [Candidatus Cloacimonas sp.]
MKTRSATISPTLRFSFWAVVTLLALWVLILGTNSFLNTWKLQRRVQTLETETLHLKALNDSLAQENERLKTDPETAEKAAREKFGLTKPDETVFRFVPAKEDDTKK